MSKYLSIFLIGLVLHLPRLACADPAMASLVAPGIISDDGAFGFTLSKDGRTALWTRSGGKRERLQIMQSQWDGKQWLAAVPSAISGDPRWKDIDPMFSPDGRLIIFQSNRPVPGKPERSGFDIWAATWDGKQAGQPYHLGNQINSDDSESSASMSQNGSIYFMKANGDNSSDIFVSRLRDGVYQPPENLGPQINTKERESNPYIAADESYLIYFTTGANVRGETDLVISFQEHGVWTKPRPLATIINSDDAEFCPFVHDGKLYFARQRKQADRMIENIYVVPFNPDDYRARQTR